MVTSTKRSAPVAGRAFAFRRQPRDRHDWRMVLVIGGLLAPLFGGLLALLGIASVFVIVAALWQLGAPLYVAALAFLLLSVLMSAATLRVCLLPTVWSLTVADDGLHVRGVAGAETIVWDTIESVESLNRGEALAAMLRYPFHERKLKSSSGMTFGGYVRIRQKNGVLLYAPENRAELLDALHTHLHRQNPRVEIPVWRFHKVVAQENDADVTRVQQAGRRKAAVHPEELLPPTR